MMNTTQEQIVNQASDFVIDEIKENLIKRVAQYTWKLTKNLSKLVWNIVKIIVPPLYDGLKFVIKAAINAAANEPAKKHKPAGFEYDPLNLYADKDGHVSHDGRGGYYTPGSSKWFK